MLNLKTRASALKWRIRSKLKRYGMAYRYATGKLTEDDGFDLIWDAQRITGCYCLESFSRESVMESAADRWGDIPELAALVDQACDRVYSKWSSNGHEADAACDWAMDLVAEYAAAEGITLKDSWSPETVDSEEP